MGSSRAAGTPTRSRWAVGAAVGLLTAAVALGVAQLVAGFVGELASPVVAVGQATIDIAPGSIKGFAIRAFGTHDKLALLVGMGVLLALLATIMGILALRHPRVGFAGLIGFGLIGVLAAESRPTADPLSPIPSIVGVVVGAWALHLLLTAATSAAPRVRTRGAALRETRPRASSGSGGRPSIGRGQLVAFDRRRFLVTGVALGGTAVVAGLG